MSIPVWFLDVDGVIAPFASPWERNAAEKKTWAPVNSAVGGWQGQIMYRKDVIDRIARLHTDSDVEIRWLTTWGEEANWAPLWPRIGLGPYEVSQPLPRSHRTLGAWWKWEVVRSFLESSHERRAIWTDDEITEQHIGQAPGGGQGWALNGYGERLLAIVPDRDLGLTPDHLDAVETWLKKATISTDRSPRT